MPNSFSTEHPLTRALIALIALTDLGLLAGCQPSVPAPDEARPAGTPLYGTLHGPGNVTPKSRPVPPAAGKQILFGDMHVHTTYSLDAYRISLPLFQGQGEGPYPVGGACDFARFCSQLDFWGLTDHAGSYTPRNWKDAKESVRQCNAAAGDPQNPDLVTFMGFEWTQVGTTPKNHYGHHNVHFLHDSEDRLPARPIAAIGRPVTPSRELAQTPLCEADVDPRSLPEDCFESVATPGELLERLDQWGFERLVIPHGSVWGLDAPEFSSWAMQLNSTQRARDISLVEIYSGRGNAEQYRPFRPSRQDANGNPVCPEPSPEYLPACWRAGEIIRSRCVASGLDSWECEARAAKARAVALAYGSAAAHLTVPGSQAEDWLDAGQTRDVFKPAFNYRPLESVQYALSLTNFDDPEGPERFRWGFIASSDNHRGRPGAGADKEFGRANMTDAIRPEPVARSAEPTPAEIAALGFGAADMERLSSFFTTSGLAAVHAAGRSREQIWNALQRREVYATSGPRILLWFDLVNAPLRGEVPMGGSARMSESPRFRVRASGAFVQRPGCPEHSLNALSPERLERLCHGECYHPSDTRYRITRIEVVKIRPQAEVADNQPPESRIEDPWKIIPCAGDGAECSVEFEDDEFIHAGLDTLYYVRAIQEPTDAINGANLRTTFDEAGNAVATNPCYGDHRTSPEDDCLSPVEERAWASPIYVDYSDSL